MSGSGIDWKSRVLNAIRDDRDAVVGPAGETPLACFSEELQRLSKQDREVLRDEVFVELINNPPENESSMVDYWQGISFLSYDLGDVGNSSAILDALFGRLLGNKALPDESRVFALRAYCAVGGRLSPLHLETLGAIKAGYPLDWLNAAVLSSAFDLATKNAKEMLRDDRLAIGAFILALDFWSDRWDRQVDFSRLVREFRNQISSQQGDQHKFDKWLRRNGIEVMEPKQEDVFSSSSPHPPIINCAWVAELSPCYKVNTKPTLGREHRT